MTDPTSPAAPPDSSPASGPRFDTFDLPSSVQAGLKDADFTRCMPIQARTLPFSLEGRDVAGQAQTGTGKTAAFLITIFARLLRSPITARGIAPRALIVAPTRELVVQIAADAALIGGQTDLAVHAVYGGVDYRKQRDILGAGVDILIGTPGRLIDYLKQQVYSLSAIEVLVIDEADRMFDMGFIKDLRFLLRRLPPVDKRQSMLFSATLSWDVMELAYEFMNEPERITISPDQITAENVEHLVYHVGNHEKVGHLLGCLAREGGERTLVFTNMKRTADDVVAALQANGYDAGAITGDVEQRKRLRVLADFKEGRLPLLVATDVASRGLHIAGVTHVINYDLPQDAEDYVHRSGRTARAGASGRAISLACERYADSLEAIEKYIGFKLPFEIPGPELMVTPVSSPARSRRPRSRAQSTPRKPASRARPAETPRPSPSQAEAKVGDAPRKRRRRRRKSAAATPTPPTA